MSELTELKLMATTAPICCFSTENCTELTRQQQLRLYDLPDDILRSISEYCDLSTRLNVTCTDSVALTSVFLGRVTLSLEVSHRFLKDTEFRLRISRRVVTPDRNLHLEVNIKEVDEPSIMILNSVRSVFVYDCIESRIDLSLLWLNQLSRIHTLTELFINNERFSNLTVLTNLTNLTALYLHDTRVSDVSALRGLTKLTHLFLDRTRVSNVSALAGLTNLTELSLWGTQVSDVSALAALTNLTRLNLSNTKVIDLSALAGLTKLNDLNLASTQVFDVSALAGLTNLAQLYLEDTRVSNVSALAGLTKLTYLSLSGSQVSDVSALASLAKLYITRSLI